jgi:hypothetical protein
MAMFIRVDVDNSVVEKTPELAAKLVEVCPVKIFKLALHASLAERRPCHKALRIGQFGSPIFVGLHNRAFAVTGGWQIDQSDEQNDERPQ